MAVSDVLLSEVTSEFAEEFMIWEAAEESASLEVEDVELAVWLEAAILVPVK